MPTGDGARGARTVTYDDVADYVSQLGAYGKNSALVTRSLVKVERTTYDQLRSHVYQVAHFLASRGVQRGDRVMIVAANSPEWVELLLGSLVMGAVVVPVDANASSATVTRFIHETAPSLVFVDEYRDLSGVAVETLPLNGLAAWIRDLPDGDPGVSLSDDWPALIVYTSGTTADPKGVVLTQRNVLANVSDVQARIEISPTWRLLSVLPLSHMYEMTGSLTCLSRGAGIFYIPRVTPLAIARALVEYRITMMLAIPELLSLMWQRIEQSAKDAGQARTLSVAARVARFLPLGARRILFRRVLVQLGGCLDLVVVGGAPTPVEVATAWERMGVRVLQGYGLTETSPILTANGLARRRLDSPGWALDHVELRIANDGEIQARGPSVFAKYWHNELATRDAFTDDGWFKTGDVGRLDDGWLRIQGRLKYAIVRASGLKVFPEDVELVLERDPRLRESCVVGVTGPQGEAVTAVVISDQTDQEVTAAIADVNSRLEPFQHIDGWRRWPSAEFPRTRLLKVDRRQVQAWALSGETVRPPRAEVPSADPLVRVIRQSLDDDSVEVADSDRLADLGLDSLLRLSVVALIEEQLGVTISDASVAPDTTVAQLRELVSEGGTVEEVAAAPRWPDWRWVRVVGNALRDGVMQAIVRVWVRSEVVGVEGLESLDGPAIFIFNHTDDFDGPVIYHALPRAVRDRLAVAVAADVMAEHGLLAFLARLCFAGFSFARREPFMPSLEHVGDLIDRRWNVLIAPEGGLSVTPELRGFKPGIGLLAVNLGVPVVPLKTIGLAGTVPMHAKWPRKRSRVTVRIGSPLRFGPQEDYADVAEALHRAMERL
jgi:long-chain acyl-CoA synthetase